MGNDRLLKKIAKILFVVKDPTATATANAIRGTDFSYFHYIMAHAAARARQLPIPKYS